MSSKVIVLSNEIIEFRKELKKILSHAAYNILYKQGWIIGKNIVKDLEVDERYFERVAEILVDRGFVSSIQLGGEEVIAQGSVEVSSESAEENVCHMLRGIIGAVYQNVNALEVSVIELVCQANGGDKCVFFVDQGMPEIDIRKKLNRIRELVEVAKELGLDIEDAKFLVREASELVKRDNFESSSEKLDMAERVLKERIINYVRTILRNCERIIERDEYAKGLYIKSKRLLDNEDFKNVSQTIRLLRDLLETS